MHIFFSVGEPSGDQHAAHLIEQLRRRRPGLTASGFGGPRMERAGCRLLYPMTDLAVMGLLQVIPLLWQFLKLLWQAGRYFREQRPDAVVLVDFPGFNWWIARQAKSAGIPVFYCLPPQLWAWASWRVRRMQKFVDHVLCSLPFEQRWYADRRVEAEFVGHPFFDEVAEYPLNPDFDQAHGAQPVGSPLPQIVGVLPGSRNHEVTRNWPLMIRIMQNLHRRHPDVRFLVACYREEHRQLCRTFLADHETELPVELYVGRTPEIIETADCCLMVSGSVSLEMLARRTPAVVLYRVGRVAYLLLRALVRVDSITLPNLIAGRRLLPEWVVAWTPQRDLQEITATLDGWLSDPQKLQAARAELSRLHEDVVQTGATARTAEAILDRLKASRTRRAA